MKPVPRLSDQEWADLQLRASICPYQPSWPTEGVQGRRLHDVANEARERVRKAYTQMDEIDRKAGLSREDKQLQRSEVMAQTLAGFEGSKTLVRAREAVRCDASPATLKALEQAAAGWERAMNKIAERAGAGKSPDTWRKTMAP